MAQGGTATRITLEGAEEDRLFFAQVREDPVLEIDALEAGPHDTVVVVSSGGCTALSLLASGAGRVVAVDLNRAQNHLVELKLAAVTNLHADVAVRFLGGWPAPGTERWSHYQGIRTSLTPGARAYWDARRRSVEKGVLGVGVSERFIGVVMAALRLGIHPPSRVRRLLACATLDEQRRFYDTEWDTWRWRLLFRVLLNRAVFRHTYDDSFFRHVDNPSFPRHFMALAEHTLTQVPVTTNYFVHHMLTGSYPRGVPGGLPPYLDDRAWAPGLDHAAARLTLVDGAFVDLLRSWPDASVDGFALSNICEWLDAEQIDELFAEVVRTAAPGARLVFRNFVGWTEVPTRWRAQVVEDRARGEALGRRDRSAVQRRTAVCHVDRAGAPDQHRVEFVARDASEADNPALLELASACPMEGDIGLCIRRRPDFFALNRLEGDRWRVGVVDGPEGQPIGCIAIAERVVHLDGRPSPSMYVSDLKVDPRHRGSGAADALTTFARDVCLDAEGEHVPTFLTILAGNRAMERRLGGPRGLPHVRRIATVRSHSISLLWPRRPPQVDGLRIERAGPDDMEEMAQRWREVAPGRQFSPVHDADSLTAWIERAPGLDPSCYRLARWADGRLAGFVGLWDQSSFKQTVVTGYSPKLAAVRLAFNTVAPAMHAPRLPPAGGELHHLTAVHVCVPPECPEVLRALVVDAYNELRGSGYSFLSIGLDAADPLSAALSGLLSQPTDIWACVATLDGAESLSFDGRPVHHEIALV
ncbi:MAG: BtaA family protein [Actinobacteria bacterium]|nr:BtaA family protein [Actinomycetota bacterium]